MTIKQKIGWLFIQLGNKISGNNYYDFGSEIISTLSFNGMLFVATKHSVFGTKDFKTWNKKSVNLTK